MPVDTFDEFVKQRLDRARQSAAALNREEKLATWQRELGSLYTVMEESLRDYTDSGQIRTERRPVQLTEDDLGSYQAQSLAISIGNDTVIAQPVGAMLIGCSGRVDLSGPRRTLRIVLLEKGGPGMKVTISGAEDQHQPSSHAPLLRGAIDHKGWYLVTSPPAAAATALDQDSFRDAIMEVAGV